MVKTYSQRVGNKMYQVAEWAGEKGPIIGIHGLTGNYMHMQALAEALSPAYHFIAYDVRGRGNSSPADEDTSILKHAEDALELVHALGHDDAIILGHSMGAYIAAAMASKVNHLKGIILLDGAGVITEKEAEKIKPALSRLDLTFSSVDKYVETIKPVYASVDLPWNAYIDASARYEVDTNEKGDVQFKGEAAAIVKDLQSVVHQYDHEVLFPTITCPALLVIATGKIGKEPLYSIASYDKTQEHIRNLNVYISDCNHYTLVLEKQPALVDRIQQFLQEVVS